MGGRFLYLNMKKNIHNFYSNQELKNLGFKKIGKNVKVSKKSSIYYPEKIIIGDNSRIDDFAVLSGRVLIGRNVHFAAHSIVNSGKKLIEFKDFSGVAFAGKVLGISDDYSGNSMTNPTVDKFFKKVKESRISIGKHAIIGANSIVLPGAEMDDYSALGAMSLLTKKINKFEIYFGIPAKKLKKRSKKILKVYESYKKNEKT